MLRTLLAALAISLSLAACAADDSEGATSTGSDSPVEATSTVPATDDSATDDSATDDTMTEEGDGADGLPITGELSYDNTQVEAGSTLTLTLTDMTDADPDTAVIAEESIDLDEGPSPIAFEISVPRSELDPQGRYSLRALVADATGTAVLTTNTANFIDPAADVSDLGTLALVSAS